MRRIAQSTILALLAAAEIDGLAFLGRVFGRRKFAPFMRSIAKRLAGAFAAGAPPIAFPGLNRDGIGGLLGHFGSSHGNDP